MRPGWLPEPPRDPDPEIRVMLTLIAKYPEEARKALEELEGK